MPVPRSFRIQRAPVIALAAWSGLVLWAVHLARRGDEGVPLCKFKWLTGVPCPGCGSTRAVLRASEGDLMGAFSCNPLLFAALLWLTLVLGLRFLFGRQVRFGFTAHQRLFAWLVLAGLLLLHWAYVIAVVG